MVKKKKKKNNIIIIMEERRIGKKKKEGLRTPHIIADMSKLNWEIKCIWRAYTTL